MSMSDKLPDWMPSNSNESTRRAVCFHEAGHCVEHLVNQRPFQRATIFGPKFGGSTKILNPSDLEVVARTAVPYRLATANKTANLLENRDKAIPAMINLLCGCEAERRHLAENQLEEANPEATLTFFFSKHWPSQGESDQERFATLRWVYCGVLPGVGFKEISPLFLGPSVTGQRLEVTPELLEQERQRFREYFEQLPQDEQAAWTELARNASELIRANWNLVVAISGELFDIWNATDGSILSWDRAIEIKSGLAGPMSHGVC